MPPSAAIAAALAVAVAVVLVEVAAAAAPAPPPHSEQSFKRTHQLLRFHLPSTESGRQTANDGLQQMVDSNLASRTAGRQKSFPEGKKSLPRLDWARLAWRCAPPAGMDETARRTPTLMLQLGKWESYLGSE